jgi:preprotein translocase subunit SecF
VRVFRFLRLIPDDTKYPFMAWRRLTFPFSAALSILAVVLFFQVGLNFGIDFRGGIMVEVQSRTGPADLAAMRSALGTLNLGDIQLQEFGAPTDVLIRVEQQPGGDEAQQAVVKRILAALGADAYDFRRVEVVGARVSGELVQAGIIGVALAFFAIWLYLWFRFEWQFAVGAMIATMHDVALTIAFFSTTQLIFDLSSIAAILTITGYSLNDTVVVYDRIRELLRRYKRVPIGEVLDMAVNATLPRTFITSTTTLLALIGLTIFGGEVIQSFTQAMIFGVLVGTYSTTFIAAPILIYLGVRTQVVEGTASAPERIEARPS